MATRRLLAFAQASHRSIAPRRMRPLSWGWRGSVDHRGRGGIAPCGRQKQAAHKREQRQGPLLPAGASSHARTLVTLANLFCVVLSGCAPSATGPEASTALAPTATQLSQPPAQSAVYPGTDWSWASSAESLGWSSAKLAVAQAYSERIGSAAVMIVDDGVIVAAWGNISQKHLCHSMRKSLLSALYGIYVAEGKINPSATLKELGIDDKTSLTEVEKTATVKDLLSARSGVYIEAAGEAAMMKAMRPPRGSHEPGTFWYYNNWDFNALGTIFDQLSGEENIYTAFEERIAEPIGMQDYDPEELAYGYEPYSMHPYYGFWLSTRDAARFGLLFLHNGRWGDQQVVPEDWVRESTAMHSAIGPQSGYGYMWWVGEGAGAFPNVDEGPGSYYASGAYGQAIIIMPARNLVVVHRADALAGDSVADEKIGTLLWLILDAAGHTNIGDPVLLERAVGERLTKETLPQVLQGSMLRGRIGGMEVLLAYDRADTVTTYLNGTPVAEGRWWLEGDYLCQGADPRGDTAECAQLLLNGSQLTEFDLDGYAEWTFEYSQQ